MWKLRAIALQFRSPSQEATDCSNRKRNCVYSNVVTNPEISRASGCGSGASASYAQFSGQVQRHVEGQPAFGIGRRLRRLAEDFAEDLHLVGIDRPQIIQCLALEIEEADEGSIGALDLWLSTAI